MGTNESNKSFVFLNEEPNHQKPFISNEMRQFELLKRQFQYLQYCYENNIDPTMMPFGMYFLFQQQ